MNCFRIFQGSTPYFQSSYVYHEKLKLGYASHSEWHVSEIKIVMSIESVDSREDIKTTNMLLSSKRHILRPTLSTDMVQWVLQWERQKRCSSRKRQQPMTTKWCYYKFSMKYFLGKRRWRQDKTREWSNLILFSFLFKTATFGHILKIVAHSLLVHGHSSWSTFNLHP